jgi:hypothetical protein
MHSHDIPNSSEPARALHLERRATPETTRSSILELAARDLDAAFNAARHHIRAHPTDAQLLTQLASATPADSDASTRFRRFLGHVIADAIAEEERAGRLARTAS